MPNNRFQVFEFGKWFAHCTSDVFPDIKYSHRDVTWQCLTKNNRTGLTVLPGKRFRVPPFCMNSSTLQGVNIRLFPCGLHDLKRHTPHFRVHEGTLRSIRIASWSASEEPHTGYAGLRTHKVAWCQLPDIFLPQTRAGPRSLCHMRLWTIALERDAFWGLSPWSRQRTPSGSLRMQGPNCANQGQHYGQSSRYHKKLFRAMDPSVLPQSRNVQGVHLDQTGCALLKKRNLLEHFQKPLRFR